jgi:hypothetical protein
LTNGSPLPINSAYNTGTDTSALRLVNVTVNVESRMQNRHVRHQRTDFHRGRLAGARSEWPAGAVQACHQLQIFGAGLGPGTVDRYEVGIVGHRFDHAVGIVSAPRLVESKLDPTNGFLICFVHGRPVMHTAWSARGTPSIA